VSVDVLTLLVSFLTAYFAAPYLRTSVLHSLSSTWVVALAPRAAAEMRPMPEFGWVFFVMAALVVLVMLAVGAYRPLTRQSRTQVVVSSALAPLAGLAAIAVILFTLRDPQWSRAFIFVFTAASVASLAGCRLSLRWYQLRRIASGFYVRHVVLAGSPRGVAWIADYLRRTTTRSEYQLIGTLHAGTASATTAEVDDLPPLGHVDGLADVLVHRPIHEVIAVQGPEGGDWLRKLAETCDYFRLTLRIVPEALLLGDLKDLQFVYRADPLKLPEVVLHPRDFASDALFLKRLMDIVMSAALLMLFAPVFAVIAIAIKLTTPELPILYRWQVVGLKGRRFTGYKFSTMVADADLQRAALLPRNEMQGPVFKIKRDPRVTPLGRYLRKFSLNELPQLWSVLKGDMSLVGPRPAFPHELARYELWHKRKLCVRPGITCLWQVRGRNRISNFDDWVRMDLEYIDNWSLWLDAKILAWTVWAVVSGSGS
jgi:exopolysaccharide biosynthesis polyprenyl glycosylphosphotransferase